MHELGIARTIVGDAAKEPRVRRATLDVGKLSGVITDAILFCFESVVAEGMALEGATLEIRQIEGWERGNACGSEFASDAPFTTMRLRLAPVQLNIKSICNLKRRSPDV